MEAVFHRRALVRKTMQAKARVACGIFNAAVVCTVGRLVCVCVSLSLSLSSLPLSIEDVRYSDIRYSVSVSVRTSVPKYSREIKT